jgi:hypothetical protein
MGALTYWKALQARSYAYPYFHPPNLFAVDPCVVKPYYVPGTFIPIYVGGNIEIHDVSGGRVKSEGSETKEFILANFLPGGYKKRWGFHHYRAVWVWSEKHLEYANICPTFRFEKSVPLNLIYTGSETFSPLNIPVQQATVYFPDQVKVEKVPAHAKYYWDEEQHLLSHADPGNAIEVARDPLSTPLYTNVIIYGEPAEHVIEFPGESLIKTIGYLEKFVLARCYYANCIHLFGKATNTLTRLVRFYHDNDDTYALLGTEHLSQATVFEFSLKPLFERIPEILQEDGICRTISECSISSYNCMNQSYTSRPLLTAPTTLMDFINSWSPLTTGYAKQGGQKTSKEFFEQETPDIELLLQELIPT